MKRLGSILFWSVVAAAFIGPGTVTTTASAGAAHGYALLWALVFSTVATVLLQEASARVTVVSGRNLAQAIRAQFGGGASGVLVLGLVLGAVVVGNAAFEAGNILGAVAGAELGTGLSAQVLTLGLGILAGLVLWVGTPRTVARLLSVTVAIMGIAFFAAAVLLRPSVGSVLAGGLVPNLPSGSLLLILGLVGTTVVPYNLFLGSGIAGGQTLGEVRFGITVAVVLGGLISMGILVVGAAVTGPFSFDALASALSARIGPAGRPLFAWGLFAAGFSSAITAPLAAAITARGLFGDDTGRWDVRGWRYRSVWLGVLLVGIAFGLAGIRPIPVILLAQALNGVLLPFAATFLLLAVNDRALMGEAGINSAFANLLMGATVAVTVVLGASGVLRAGATAAGFSAPGEQLLLGTAALIAAVLAVPVFRAARHRRKLPAAI